MIRPNNYIQGDGTGRGGQSWKEPPHLKLAVMSPTLSLTIYKMLQSIKIYVHCTYVVCSRAQDKNKFLKRQVPAYLHT